MCSILTPSYCSDQQTWFQFSKRNNLELNYVLGTFFLGPSSLCSAYKVTVGCSLFRTTTPSINLTLQQLYFPDWERCKTWATANWKTKKAFFFFIFSFVAHGNFIMVGGGGEHLFFCPVLVTPMYSLMHYIPFLATSVIFSHALLSFTVSSPSSFSFSLVFLMSTGYKDVNPFYPLLFSLNDFLQSSLTCEPRSCQSASPGNSPRPQVPARL